MRVPTACAVLTLGAIWHSAAAGQDPLPACDETGLSFGAGPTLLSDSEGDRSIGARLRLAACGTGHTQLTGPVKDPNGFPASWVLLATGGYLWAGSDVVSPDPNEVRLAGGLSVSLSRPDRVAPDTVPPQCLPFYDGGGFYWGFVDLVATASYESSVDRSEQNVTGGGELRYARTGRGRSRLVPSVVVRVEAVEPTGSEARDTLGVGDASDRHGRFGARAYWYAPLPWNLTAQADATAFRTRGLEAALRSLGWHDGQRLALTLRSGARKALGPVTVGSVYVRWAYGQEATVADNEHAVSAGLSIDFGRDRPGLAGVPASPVETGTVDEAAAVRAGCR